MFETFCLRLAAGLVLSLLVLPAGAVAARFFRIHLLIGLGLTVAAAVAATENELAWFWLALGLAIGVGFAGYAIWRREGAPGGHLCLVVNAAALMAALISRNASKAPNEFALAFTEDASAAALLGSAMTAMLMGHWYLIAPTMSLEPLLRMLRALFFALGVRGVVAIVAAAQLPYPVHADRVLLVWLALRWGAGVLGAFLLAWMAWQSARIRSTQSATGILYVVVIFVFIGELTDQLIRSHVQGWPTS